VESRFLNQAKTLAEEQKLYWEQCKNGYATLDSVEVKTFQFESFSIKVQVNPGRLISTSAKVDAKSINERKCFLCKNNLPDEQQAVEYKDDFLILVNPFPIFPEHFTLPSLHHVKQSIENSIPVLLDFSKDLSPDYTAFYNGPRCGASAPDHLHFQAGTKNFMTIDGEYHPLKETYGEKIFENVSTALYAINDGLRKIISIEGNDKITLENTFKVFYSTLKKINNETEELMLNLIGSFQNEAWRIIIFIRKKHRPDVFFEEDEEKRILLSPAAVDIGGVCVTPRRMDFDSITKEKLSEIFREVFVDDSEFQKLKSALTSALILAHQIGDKT